jgi:hypothetical protein
MNGHDELRDLWSCEPPSGETKGEDIMAMVQRKTRAFDRMIAVRNLTECAAAGLVMVFFAYIAFRAGDALTRAGAIVVAAGGAWIIFYLLRYGTASAGVDPSRDSAGYARALLERYDRQIRLLKSVKYWYLLPMYAGLLIMSAGGLLRNTKSGILGWRDFAGPAFYTAVFAFVWWLNEVHGVRLLRRQRARLLEITGESDILGSER